MEKAIIVRYGEIGIKSSWVRKEFENQLIDNISRVLVKNGVDIEKITKVGGRIYVWCSKHKKAMELIKNVFGIVSYSSAKKIKSDIEGMKKEALKMYLKDSNKKKKTFRISTRRIDKSFPMTSMEVSSEIGAFIVKKTNAKVDLKNYDVNICIEITKNHAFAFSQFNRGFGGLPIGAQEKVLCYVSKEKETKINTFLMARRGCEIVLAGDSKKFAKDFEREYYHFRNKMDYFEIGKFDFEKINEIAKKENAKAIVLPKKYACKHEKSTEFPIFYPSLGSGLSFYRNINLLKHG